LDEESGGRVCSESGQLAYKLAGVLMLIAIGYWHVPGEQDGLFHPRSFVSKGWLAHERDAVCKYLASGERCTEYLGYSACRFSCGITDDLMGNADLTDGVWVWPEGLSHYVSRHNVMLPEEFILHMRKCSYTVAPEARHASNDQQDFAFWVEWCRLNRKQSILSRFFLKFSDIGRRG